MSKPSDFLAFVRLVKALDYPLYVVTTAVQNEPTGCLVGFTTQCSIHLPRFLACISRKNHSFQLAGRAATLSAYLSVALSLKPSASTEKLHQAPRME